MDIVSCGTLVHPQVSLTCFTAFIWVSFGGFVIGDPLHGLGARPTHTEHAEPQRAVHLAELSRRLAGSRFAAFSRASQPCRTGFHPVVVVLDCSVKLRFDSFKKEKNVNLEIFTEGVPYSFCSLVVLKWWVLVEFVSVSLWGTLSSSSVVWGKGAEALALWQPLKAGWFSHPSAEVFQLFTSSPPRMKWLRRWLSCIKNRLCCQPELVGCSASCCSASGLSGTRASSATCESKLWLQSPSASQLTVIDTGLSVCR